MSVSSVVLDGQAWKGPSISSSAAEGIWGLEGQMTCPVPEPVNGRSGM